MDPLGERLLIKPDEEKQVRESPHWLEGANAPLGWKDSAEELHQIKLMQEQLKVCSTLTRCRHAQWRAYSMLPSGPGLQQSVCAPTA